MSIIDRLYSDWARVGVALSVEPTPRSVSIESLVLRTVARARAEPRLFAVAASWLSVHHNLVNARLLGKMIETAAVELSALTGVLLEVALETSTAGDSLRSAIQHCRPAKRKSVLFNQYAESQVLSDLARRESLGLFRKWGFWHNEVSLRIDAIRSVSWVLKQCPELRLRALLGAGLEAEILSLVLDEPLSATDLEKCLPYTYPAIYESALRLEGKGLVRRVNEGRRMPLVVPDEIRTWFEAFPVAA